jgi:hypothetical protein
LKATGRYVIRNSEALVSRIVAQPNLPDVQLNLHNQLSYADSRIFLFSRAYFDRYLYPRRGEIDDAGATWLEHVLARAALEHIAAGGDWKLLPLPLWVRGVAGTTGKVHRETAIGYGRARVKHWVKLRSLGTSAEL